METKISQSETRLRLAALRRWMEQRTIEVFVVPTADPHGSEYIAAHWKTREWLTGFTGSAGTAVVTATEARLWTDSRYWLQAASQLAASDFVLMKEGARGVPSPEEWLRANCGKRGRVALVAECLPWQSREDFGFLPTDMLPADDPFDEIWADRPPLPSAPVKVQPYEWTHVTAKEKLSALSKRFDAYLVSNLADIAWLLNLRGADIEYNPVFLAYLLVADEGSILFSNPARFSPEALSQLNGAGVRLMDYADVGRVLGEMAAGGREISVPPSTNCAILNLSSFCPAENGGGGWVLAADDPVEPMRAVKNAAEVSGFRKAMERDGVALVKFRRWLDENVGSGCLTEISVDERLTALRAEQEGYDGLSFATIAAYGPHGAIVHYEAEPATAATLRPESLLLLDSGGQYDCGTTDITRTIALGTLTAEERRVYTLVLKGHIALARMEFPEGTTGLQLDTAARMAMWREGYDFGHGTGHGVGSHLCVHEGPLQIRKNVRACTTKPYVAGMTVTDEPGIYVENRFGVRIENTLLVVPARETPFGRFLRFETLTLCPIDTAPIDFSMMNDEERNWLNDYHAHVRSRLMPLLTDEVDRRWLEENTKKL